MVNRSRSKAIGLLGSAAWNITLMLIIAVMGFVTVPIVLRGIGSANYGAYSIISMIGGFVALQDMGLGEATLRFVSKYYERNDLDGINRVLGATLSVYLMTGLICCTGVMLFAQQITGLFKLPPHQFSDAVLALRIACIGFMLSTIGTAFQKIPEAMQRYDISSRVDMVLTLLHSLLLITVVKLGFGLVGIVTLLAIKAGSMVLIYGSISYRLIPDLRCCPHFDRAGIKEVFSYGIFSFTNSIIGKFSLYIDRFILGAFFGASDVAYLSVPKDLIDRVSGFVGAAGKALFPKFSSMDEGEALKEIYSFSLWALLCFSIIIFIPFAIVIPSFVEAWISPEFSQKSGTLCRLLAIGTALNGSVGAYFALLKGTNRVHWLSVIFSTLTVISIVVTAILVYSFGLIGTGIRMILFSWCGIALCFIVGSKVFNSFCSYRRVAEVFIIPFVVACVVLCFGINIWDKLHLSGWWYVIFGGAFLVSVTASMLLLSDLFFFRKGYTCLLYNRAIMLVYTQLGKKQDSK